MKRAEIEIRHLTVAALSTIYNTDDVVEKSDAIRTWRSETIGWKHEAPSTWENDFETVFCAALTG